jgi:hypothetical protein
VLLFFAEEIFALITTASAAVPLAPSIETHACPNFRVPQQNKTNALGHRRNRSGEFLTHALFSAYMKKGGRSSD